MGVDRDRLRRLAKTRKWGAGLQSERGVTLIEVVISIAVLGIVAVAVMGYLRWSTTVFHDTDVRATAESVARTEMERIKGMQYVDEITSYNGTSSFSGFAITNTVASTTPGLQLITVTVVRSVDPVVGSRPVTVEGYKQKR